MLGHLKERYLTAYANGTIEANSLDTCRLHLGHFARVLGEGFPLSELSLAKLQENVNQRAKSKISLVTIRKEIATLRAAWSWESGRQGSAFQAGWRGQRLRDRGGMPGADSAAAGTWLYEEVRLLYFQPG